MHALQDLVGAALPVELYFAGIDDPAANGLARLLLSLRRLTVDLQRLPGHLHMHVDAIQQGTRDAHAVASDAVESTVTAVAAVSQVAARTPLRCLFAI